MSITGKSMRKLQGRRRSTTIMLDIRAAMKKRPLDSEELSSMRRRGTKRDIRLRVITTSTTRTNSTKNTNSTMTSTRAVNTIGMASSMPSIPATRAGRRRHITSTQDTTSLRKERRDTLTRATWTPITKATMGSMVTNITTRITQTTVRKVAKKVHPSGATRKTRSYVLGFKSQSPLGFCCVICHLGMLFYSLV